MRFRLGRRATRGHIGARAPVEQHHFDIPDRRAGRFVNNGIATISPNCPVGATATSTSTSTRATAWTWNLAVWPAAP